MPTRRQAWARPVLRQDVKVYFEGVARCRRAGPAGAAPLVRVTRPGG